MYSPMEMDMAFAIAAARDAADGEKMDQWKRPGVWWIAHVFNNTSVKSCLLHLIGTFWRSVTSTDWMMFLLMCVLTWQTSSNIILPFQLSPPAALDVVWGCTWWPVRRGSALTSTHTIRTILIDQNHSFHTHIVIVTVTSIHLRTFELHGVALKHSPLQLMYNVIAFKIDYESKHGAVSHEALAKLYDAVPWSNPDEAAPWTAVTVVR